MTIPKLCTLVIYCQRYIYWLRELVNKINDLILIISISQSDNIVHIYISILPFQSIININILRNYIIILKTIIYWIIIVIRVKVWNCLRNTEYIRIVNLTWSNTSNAIILWLNVYFIGQNLLLSRIKNKNSLAIRTKCNQAISFLKNRCKWAIDLPLSIPYLELRRKNQLNVQIFGWPWVLKIYDHICLSLCNRKCSLTHICTFLILN